MMPYPVQVDDLAVCVAINDKDRAWYEMLVPFILSLRRTNFNGHIAVIDFGLSERKREILREQAINVLIATEPSLAVGRYLEVAKLCEFNTNLRKVALYDADIWFCTEQFDLFDAVEGENLYACPDALFCTFITDPLIGPRQQENLKLVSDGVTEQFGAALQAGLVAGTSEAWRDFGRHVRDCVDRIGTDFTSAYGFDTTILHLWAAHRRLNLLSESQNYVIKNGIQERRNAAGEPVFLCPDGPIRAMHMTSDIRFVNCWRYAVNHRDEALKQGLPYALVSAETETLDTIPEDLRAAFAALGFEIEAMAIEKGGTLHTFDNSDGLHVMCMGNHTIAMRATRPNPLLFLNVMYLTGSPPPTQVRFNLDAQEIVMGRDVSQWLTMVIPAGAQMTLSSESLPGQMCKMVWIVADRVYLWQ